MYRTYATEDALLIPDHLWSQMTPEQQELVKETITGQRNRGKCITCPHCQGRINVLLAVEITATDIPAPRPAVTSLPPQGVGRLPKHYQNMLDAAKASGLYAHFLAALQEQNPQSKIQDADVVFCKYWTEVQPVHLTARQSDLLWTSYGQRVEVWGVHGVYTIVQGDEVKAFVPQRFLKSSVGHNKFTFSVAPQFETWVKGPYGYVPIESRGFASELRRQNIGKFGVLVQ